MSETIPFHPLVHELAEDLGDELDIPVERAQAWITRLSAHPDGEEIATHVAVLAMRLGKAGAHRAAAQLVSIAMMSFSQAAAASVATAAGVQMDQAKKLTGWKQDPMAKGMKGLAAPVSGVGPRRKK